MLIIPMTFRLVLSLVAGCIFPLLGGAAGQSSPASSVVPSACSNVRDLELADINVDFQQTDHRPAANFSNIQYLGIDNFNAELAEGVKPAVFAPDVTQKVIRNSPVLEP